MASKTKPFDLSELDEVVSLASPTLPAGHERRTNWRGYVIEEASDGEDFFVYNEDEELVGGAETQWQAMHIVRQIIAQGVKHESQLQ